MLIKWQSKPKEEATWEFCDTIPMQFPAFQLEDKLSLLRGGNDRNTITSKIDQRNEGPNEKTWKVCEKEERDQE